MARSAPNLCPAHSGLDFGSILDPRAVAIKWTGTWPYNILKSSDLPNINNTKGYFANAFHNPLVNWVKKCQSEP